MPILYADAIVTAETSEECAVPGYPVVRLRRPGATLTDLEPVAEDVAGRLKRVLTAAGHGTHLR